MANTSKSKVKEKMINIRENDYNIIKKLAKSEDRTIRGTISQMVKSYTNKDNV